MCPSIFSCFVLVHMFQLSSVISCCCCWSPVSMSLGTWLTGHPGTWLGIWWLQTGHLTGHQTGHRTGYLTGHLTGHLMAPDWASDGSRLGTRLSTRMDTWLSTWLDIWLDTSLDTWLGMQYTPCYSGATPILLIKSQAPSVALFLRLICFWLK